MTPTVLPAVHVDPAPGPAKPDPPAGTPETPAGTPSTVPHRSASTAATVESNADSVYISHQAYEAAFAAQLNDAPQ